MPALSLPVPAGHGPALPEELADRLPTVLEGRVAMVAPRVDRLGPTSMTSRFGSIGRAR